MSKYAIWDKKKSVITPSGKKFTPEQWIEMHPIAGLEGVKVIMGGGLINGSVLMEFNQTVENFKEMGCDFSDCLKDQDYLDAIEKFEKEQNEQSKNVVSTEERIAAALEAQVLMSMDDMEA